MRNFLKQEVLNYFCSLIFSPKLLFKSLSHFFKKTFQIGERRFASPMHYYPKDIKRAVKECLDSKAQIKWSLPAKRSPDLNIDSLLLIEPEIKLASITLKSKEVEGPWNVEFEDGEDSMALHRWNWLLTSITVEKISRNVVEENQKLIEEWTAKFLDKKDNLVWDSYSTGERICNGLLFYWLINKVPAKEVINNFQEFAEHLIGHLEYRGQNTNNHIINNARALYFAGRFLGIEQWQNLAQLIFKKELPKFITPDGFLREGSSHYHFLFTRWVLEVLWLAREGGDDKFISFLEPLANQLVKQCWFFLIWNQDKKEWTMPLIGDISPDFTPDWLLNVPWSKVALSVFRSDRLSNRPKNGWANLFEEIALGENEPIFISNCYEYKNSGWYRFDHNDLTLFIRIKFDETLSYPTHDHNDLGSFCLYIKGSPVIIDPGRLNYTMDNLSQYGISAKAHNTILVNGLELTPFFKKWFAVKEYTINKPEMTTNKLNNDIMFALKFYGFERLVNKRVVIIRQFHLSENRFIIEDFFEGEGFRNIKTSFHFAPDIKIEQSENTYNLLGPFANKVKFIIEQGQRGKIIEDWYFPEYGKKQKSETLVVNKDINLSSKINYQLFWL